MRALNNLSLIARHKPLVVNITNLVAANFSANALLAIGASPFVITSRREVEEVIRSCNALVINTGTVGSHQLGTMKAAAEAAHRVGIPWVLDPAGAAASGFRLECCRSLIFDYKPTVIRANASEIKALALNSVGKSRGVDSTIDAKDAWEFAEMLASKTGAVVCVSGETDFITDGIGRETVSSGSAMMKRVTAMGCVSSAVVAAFLGVDKDGMKACADAMNLVGNCGGKAAAKSEGPGSFASAFIDELYRLSSDEA